MPEGSAVNDVYWDPADREAMACLRLIQGAAPQAIAFHRDEPSRLMVGSDSHATLRIERADVAPRQLEIVWDGAQLWVQDALRLGRTFVNGRTLNEWLPIVGRAVVCFGGVRLWLIAKTAPPRQHTPDFDALDRAQLTEDQESADCRLSQTMRITLTPELLRQLNEQDAL